MKTLPEHPAVPGLDFWTGPRSRTNLSVKSSSAINTSSLKLEGNEQMMKFREFVKRRRAKATSSKRTDQSSLHATEPDYQVKPKNDTVLIGADCAPLPIPARPGEVG